MSFAAHLKEILDLFLHLDVYLQSLFDHYGSTTFILLFIVIFCETGLIFTPFFPGDSLLFATGSIIATTHLSVYVLISALILAAFLGDNANYWIGRTIGRKLAEQWFSPSHWVLKREYLERTEAFYQKRGITAIILARFIPIIRTFCPFISGIARMRYPVFAGVSFFAATLWVGLVTYVGYRFGNIPSVKTHFSWVIVGILLLSMLPLFRGIFRRFF